MTEWRHVELQVLSLSLKYQVIDFSIRLTFCWAWNVKVGFFLFSNHFYNYAYYITKTHHFLHLRRQEFFNFIIFQQRLCKKYSHTSFLENGQQNVLQLSYQMFLKWQYKLQSSITITWWQKALYFSHRCLMRGRSSQVRQQSAVISIQCQVPFM